MCSVYIFHCKHSNSRSPFGINICILGRQPSEEKGKRVRELYECEKNLVRDLEKWYILRPYFNIHIFCCDENKKCTLCYGDVITVNSST